MIIGKLRVVGNSVKRELSEDYKNWFHPNDEQCEATAPGRGYCPNRPRCALDEGHTCAHVCLADATDIDSAVVETWPL